MSEETRHEEEVEVQNNVRERRLVEILGLTPLQGRAGADAVDAQGNRFELKTGTRGDITTARDVGPDTLAHYRTLYWVVARGRNLRTGFVIDEVYFLAPRMLEDWFRDIERRYFDRDQALIQAALGILRGAGFTGDLDRLAYLLNRGMTLNNPKIPWHYVRSHGVRLNLSNDPRNQVVNLVAQYPISRQC